ncbi:MAG: adenosine kinase [Moraxellaceae bacterium]|jgi:sugar/nucleoside kinase (ribokinase family)|nr:adenosine kinase [Moraxellaceae bacterium]MBP9730238.1 adenosine kinase [Moraxellaceae bacterium]MCC6200449.1 adenosine kinase [Moraxellaceae bacterium]
MSHFDVYAIGNALVDTEYRVTDDFLSRQGIAKGMMTLIDEPQQQKLLSALDSEFGMEKRASGGSAANTIIALAAFGGQSFYSCKVASDGTGDFYVHDLHAAGVSSNLKADRDTGTTGTCVVMVTPDAERTMHTYLGITADVSVQELQPEALAASSWLYIEGYLVSSDSARAAVKEARQIARANGTPIAMTFSDPAMVRFFKPGLAEMLDDGVDLLFCNEEEACLWADALTVGHALDSLKQVARQVVITRGKAGALVWDGEKGITIAPNPATPLDTNGAGDMFAGAYLFGLTRGWSPERAGALASKAAAAVVGQFGPRLPLDAHAALLREFNAT